MSNTNQNENPAVSNIDAEMEKFNEQVRKKFLIGQSSTKPTIRKPAPEALNINYNGITITEAARQGDLPVCVLLWGIAAAKKQTLMVADGDGNTPMHFACLASTIDVMAFFNQQLNGMFDSETRLVNVKNNSGETPLLRAMMVGESAVVKALLDEKSDVFARDNNNNTIFIVAAKYCRLWMINFVFDYISINHGADKAKALLQAYNDDGKGPLEYAAESGDINCIELLIRRGLSPYQVHADTRESLLHIAVKNHRIDVVQFLLSIGCDYNLKDGMSLTIFQYPALKQDVELARIIHKFVRNKKLSSCFSKADHLNGTNKSDVDKLGYKDSRGRTRSHAVNRVCPSRIEYCLIYAAITLGYLIVTIVVPFWGWFPLLAASGGAFFYVSSQVGTLQRQAMQAQGRLLMENWQSVVGAPEKMLGFWIGAMLTFLFYAISCLACGPSTRHLLGFKGVDAYDYHPTLLPLVVLFCVLTIASWTSLVWLQPDPGMVDTRSVDFEEVMNNSSILGGKVPNANQYCKTTLMRKPVRSKYCTTTGLVVARYDHLCVWLNGAVGYGNHRMFMIFLYCHEISNILMLVILISTLQREVSGESASLVLGQLLSQDLLFVTVITVFLLFVSCFITLLVVEQTYHIFTNMTTNEKVNGSRYAWMKGHNGESFNRFSKGYISNFLEFWRLCSYGLDYTEVMEIPHLSPAPQRGKSSSSELYSSSNAIHQHSHNCNHGVDDLESGGSGHAVVSRNTNTQMTRLTSGISSSSGGSTGGVKGSNEFNADL